MKVEEMQQLVEEERVNLYRDFQRNDQLSGEVDEFHRDLAGARRAEAGGLEYIDTDSAWRTGRTSRELELAAQQHTCRMCTVL
jgi:hypothetical protein